MRFYTQQHQYYCVIDLHARAMYVCVLDGAGDKLVHRNIPARPAPLLKLLEPYRPDVVVGVECMFTWNWIADLCEAEGLPFVLGHALYMKAIHGGKAKNDRIDSHKIAAILRGGNFPQACVSEAATTFIRHCPEGRRLYERLVRKHGKGKALSVLAHKLARAAGFMLRRQQTFDIDRLAA